MAKIGEMAPDFRVKDHTGKERTLAEFRGKWVVLWFFPKADTPGCTAEGCGFRDRSENLLGLGAQVLGVSFDTVPENAAFAAKFHFPFPLLCDTERALGTAYGAATDAKASHARRITALIRPDGRLERIFEKVDVRAHATEIEGAIQAASRK